MSDQRHINLGKRLCEQRELQGLSQRKLAEIAQMSHSAYHNIEHGETDPKTSTIFKLADALGVPVHTLFM